MDIAVKSVRISLLALMTFAFAAIWSADYSTASASVNRPRIPIQRRPKTDFDIPPSDQPQNHFSASTGSSKRNVATTSDFPVPAGIRTGTYLIVDQVGHTSTCRIVQSGSDDGHDSTGILSTDHYTSTRGSARWHFIRIQPVTNERVAILPESTSRIQ